MTAKPTKNETSASRHRHGAEWRLYRDRRVVGRVVPDAKWPGMWRVQLPGGLSEMVNLARARDAALDWSATPRCHKVLQQNQRRFSAPASPVRLNRRILPSAPGRLEKRTRLCLSALDQADKTDVGPRRQADMQTGGVLSE